MKKNVGSLLLIIAIAVLLISIKVVISYLNAKKLSNQNNNIKKESLEIFQLLMSRNPKDTFHVWRRIEPIEDYKIIINNESDSIFVSEQLAAQSIDTSGDIIFLPSDSIRQQQSNKNISDTNTNYHLAQTPNIFSSPVFSYDLQNAIVSISYHCEKCGEGVYLLCDKYSGKWRVTKIINQWVE